MVIERDLFQGINLNDTWGIDARAVYKEQKIINHIIALSKTNNKIKSIQAIIGRTNDVDLKIEIKSILICINKDVLICYDNLHDANIKCSLYRKDQPMGNYYPDYQLMDSYYPEKDKEYFNLKHLYMLLMYYFPAITTTYSGRDDYNIIRKFIRQQTAFLSGLNAMERNK